MREMLNIEKYKDKLIDLEVIDVGKLAIEKGKPRICQNTICSDCTFHNKDKSDPCEELAVEWLFSEYEEPEVDWSKVKVDTPILVRDYESSEWTKRYFAKFEDGKVYAWKYGATSWTANNEYAVTPWKYAKLAESEE
ncbi:MAG: hypothetical protein ACLU1S_01145 [Eubacterium sp.]